MDKSIFRKKAEELLKKQSLEKRPEISEINSLKLIHELEVHQIELEMINDELNKANILNKELASKYIELYDFAPNGYFSINKNDEIIELNFAGSKMFGKERSKVKTSKFGFFVSPKTRTIYNEFLEKVFSSGLQQTCEVVISTNGDEPMYLYLTGISVENGDYCLVTAIDSTKNEQAKEKLRLSSEKFHDLVDSSGGIVWEADAQTLIFSYVSEEAERLLGYPIEDWYKEGFWVNNLHPDEKDRIIEFCASQTKQLEAHDFMYRFKAKKGNYVWLRDIVSVVVGDGKPLRLRGIMFDITKQKQAELEIIKSKEQAEESDLLKSAFLANMSHEIRTPMNGILGFSNLLKEPNLSGDQQQKYIGVIEKSGKRMLNIINDIIDISKIEAGLMHLEIKESNINEQIEYMYTFFKTEVEAKGMQLFFKNILPAKEVTIKTDREKLFAILTNLVKNAIKYSNEGSIEIGCVLKKGSESTNQNQHAELEFFVKDTGIGIPKDRQEAIFERFIQAEIEDSMARQGAGLGLSITKAYVEMLGGKIWVESEEGIGSTFYFTLPYTMELKEEISIKDIEVTDSSENPIKDLKILIAEDDEISEMLLSVNVSEFSNEIIIATTGREAVEICRNNPTIDLILMDIQMPEMNGYEATRQIRQFNKEVIIIAQTAYGLAGDRGKSLNAGCNDYITKPIDKLELELLIQKYFNKE